MNKNIVRVRVTQNRTETCSDFVTGLSKQDQAVLAWVLDEISPRLEAIWAGCQTSLERIERASYPGLKRVERTTSPGIEAL
jgi:hypothetical protein